MFNTPIEKEILGQIAKLAIEQQRQVLKFAHTLVQGIPVGIPGTELLRFAGGIEMSDLKLMSNAIENGCEQVDLNEW